MAQATGFQIDLESGNVSMNQGDTGSFTVHCSRKNGESWPSQSRMLFTIKNTQGAIMMQRIYRLDDQWGLGDGVVLIEFHNNDTDEWDTGSYQMERRYNVNPIWEGTPSDARCVDALADGAAKMIEGVTVRTVFQGTLKIDGVQGKI